jgi:hypothetical protein
LIAPFGVHFSIVLLTDSMMLPSSSCSAKDRWRMDLYALDLCGIVTTGDTLSCHRWVFLMSSHRTTRACPFATLSATLFTKCVIALGSISDLCGPRSIATYISSIIQSHPVLVGHLFLSPSLRRSPASCLKARPCSAISLASDVFCLSSQ